MLIEQVVRGRSTAAVRQLKHDVSHEAAQQTTHGQPMLGAANEGPAVAAAMSAGTVGGAA